MKGLLKKGTLVILVMLVFTVLLAPVAVHAGERDIPRIFSVEPTPDPDPNLAE